MQTPSTNWKEKIPADEAERFEGYAQEIRELQRKRAGKTRALYAKGVAGVEAEFSVLPDLPEPARIGLFAKPATHAAYVRFSNGSAMHQPDRKPDVRGIAIKVLGVDGRKIIPGMEKARTQDFLLNHNAALPFANADQFVGLVRAGTAPHKLLPWLVSTFGFGGTLRLLPKLKGLVGMPTSSLAQKRFHSGAAIQFGPVLRRRNPHADRGRVSRMARIRFAVHSRRASDAQAAGPRFGSRTADRGLHRRFVLRSLACCRAA